MVLTIESVITSHPSSTIVIAGDFNQLDTSRLNTDYGLLQIVTTPTHNLNLIDKVFVNQPDNVRGSLHPKSCQN